MPVLLRLILVGFLRYALGGLTLWLFQRGLLHPGEENEFYFALAVAIATLGSIVWSKVKLLRLFHTGIAVRGDHSPDEVRQMVNNGTYAPATTPKYASPEIQRR